MIEYRNSIEILRGNLTAEGMNEFAVISDHFLIVQTHPLRCPDIQSRLTWIRVFKLVKIKTGIVADHPVEILSVKLRFDPRVFVALR